VIFAGLTMFDFQRLRRTEDIHTAPLLAASIFPDVLNVFSSSCRFSAAASSTARDMTSGFHGRDRPLSSVAWMASTNGGSKWQRLMASTAKESRSC